MSRELPGAGLRLALAGGGTGGHLVPGLHLLDDLAERGGALESLVWLTGGRPVERRVLAGLQERIAPVPVRIVELNLDARGGGAPSHLRQLWRMGPAARHVRRALLEERSQAILGLGGFVCGPSIVGARFAGVPRALLEINAHEGTATRWLGRLASRVFHAWPATVPESDPKGRHVLTGAPLAPAFRPASAQQRSRAKASLGFEPQRPLLLVLGGSQGAGSLNAFVASEAQELVDGGCSVLLQAGPGKLPVLPPRLGEAVRCVEYLDDMPLALAAADLMLGRGGASTLAEVAAAQVPAWVVPYPHHADRHQERNAQQLGEGARVLAEPALGPELTSELVEHLSPAGNAARRRSAEHLARAHPPGAALRIWEQLEVISRSRALD